MSYRFLIIGMAVVMAARADAQASCGIGCTTDSIPTATIAPVDDRSRLAKDADDSALPWVLWSNQGEYYAAACNGAWQIPPDRKLYTRDEITLRRLGYRRATAQREDCTANQVLDHAERVRAARRR